MNTYLLILFFIVPCLCFSNSTFEEKKFSKQGAIAKFDGQEHYSSMLKALENKEWKRLEKEAYNLGKNFSKTPYASDVSYYLGVAYFNLGDYELANSEFTNYLTCQVSPKFFESAIQHKFQIAEGFRTGKRKHFLGLRTLPRWTSARLDALSIYDEVVSAFPHHELAAHSLYGKSQILASQEDFQTSIETYQTLIRRFPKHFLAIESYLGIGEVYLLQARTKYPDPNYLDLSEVNLRKFASNFPKEEKLELARKTFFTMQEYYASCFYETARFYEKTKKWGAAKIYYKKILAKYPDSEIAVRSLKRLNDVESKVEFLKINKK